jgi:prepilin-type N-terminal cleavage/methylation domain-containing protein
MVRRHRPGFTLIELLVVIAIIALMMALLLPAIQKVREAANKLICASNLRQVAIAVHHYHNDNNRLPPVISANGFKGFGFTSAFTMILPYVEQDNIAKDYRPEIPPTSPPNDAIANRPLKIFLCPTMELPNLPPNPTYSSYGFCVGRQYAWAHLIPGYPTHDGAMVPADQGRVTLTNIYDGTSNTFLAGEMHYNVKDYSYTSGPYTGAARLGNTCWVFGYPSYSFGSTFVTYNKKTHTGPITDTGIQAFRSEHPTGANFIFSDGSVRSISYGISHAVYQALSTRNGGEAVDQDY